MVWLLQVVSLPRMEDLARHLGAVIVTVMPQTITHTVCVCVCVCVYVCVCVCTGGHVYLKGVFRTSKVYTKTDTSPLISAVNPYSTCTSSRSLSLSPSHSLAPSFSHFLTLSTTVITIQLKLRATSFSCDRIPFHMDEVRGDEMNILLHPLTKPFYLPQLLV